MDPPKYGFSDYVCKKNILSVALSGLRALPENAYSCKNESAKVIEIQRSTLLFYVVLV